MIVKAFKTILTQKSQEATLNKQNHKVLLKLFQLSHPFQAECRQATLYLQGSNTVKASVVKEKK